MADENSESPKNESSWAIDEFNISNPLRNLLGAFRQSLEPRPGAQTEREAEPHTGLTTHDAADAQISQNQPTAIMEGRRGLARTRSQKANPMPRLDQPALQQSTEVSSGSIGCTNGQKVLSRLSQMPEVGERGMPGFANPSGGRGPLGSRSSRTPMSSSRQQGGDSGFGVGVGVRRHSGCLGVGVRRFPTPSPRLARQMALRRAIQARAKSEESQDKKTAENLEPIGADGILEESSGTIDEIIDEEGAVEDGESENTENEVEVVAEIQVDGDAPEQGMFGISKKKLDRSKVVWCYIPVLTLVFSPLFIGFGGADMVYWQKAQDYQANSADRWQTSLCQIESHPEIIQTYCSGNGNADTANYCRYQCKLRVKMNEYTNDDGSLKVLEALKLAVWTKPNLLYQEGKTHPARQFTTRKAAKKFRDKYVQDEWYVCYHKGGDENGPKRLAMKVGGKPFKRSLKQSIMCFWIGIGCLVVPVVVLILYGIAKIEETCTPRQLPATAQAAARADQGNVSEMSRFPYSGYERRTVGAIKATHV